jgi:hypothetical protein
MSTDRSPRGASPVGDPEERRRRGFPLWLAALLGLLVLGLILFLLLRGNGDDADTAIATPDSASTADAPGSEGTPNVDADGSGTASPLATGDGSSGQAGTLAAAGQPLLPLPAGGLAQYADQPAEARGAVVQAVVADEGFWVGDSEQDRVFAFLAIGGESAPQVAAGQPVTFNGTLRPVPADPAAAFGLTAEDGLDQLTQQGHYIEVTEVTETP